MSAVESGAAARYVVPFARLSLRDVSVVGGKNASLGELLGALARLGIRVPNGFATTAWAYREFLAQDGLHERIGRELAALDVENIAALAAAGRRIREWILATRRRSRQPCSQRSGTSSRRGPTGAGR
jgi:pyruvate,water dikinase